MPPPVTPSPHRFKPLRDSRSSHKPPSSLRQALPPPSPHTPHDREPRHNVSSSQFKPTPRFSVPASRHDADVTGSQFSRNAAPGTQQFGPSLDTTDSIEDSSQQDVEAEEQGDPADEMLWDSESRVVVESVEPRHASIAHSHGDIHMPQRQGNADFFNENPAKRRRLSLNADAAREASVEADPGRSLARRPSHGDTHPRHDPSTVTQRAASLSNPTSPPRTARPPRFKHSEATPHRAYSLDPTTADPLPPPSTTSSRPRNPFRLPPSSRNANNADFADATPLPEHFSPHRRNQKFVPGGMAETVRGWVLGVGHGPDSSRSSSQLSRMVVSRSTETVGANPLRLLAGTAATGESGEDVRALLVGPARGGRAGVAVGDEVSIAAPSWDVDVGSGAERRRWIVGVDWSVDKR
ncbi:uncharacterized protein J3D65DRAFT_449099 [Phyllosticta citribraziliensis]|uniref:Uncharacterized protein n=1 Tax=Phyllosticta citribraziliensis TaxID=989973 RepID=A0ABR1LJF2_9PEZI